jgi:hypothetical protein
MKKIVFKDVLAQQIYDNYMISVENAAKSLSREDKIDTIMEINSHLYEGMLAEGSGTEIERIISLTTKLGDPYSYLKPVVAERKLNEAVRTFNPKHIFAALLLNIGNGFRYTFFFVMYLVLLALICLLFLKVFYPGNTGLFYAGGSISSFGFKPNLSGEVEVLHGWFYPVLLVVIFLLYMLITLSLKLTRKRKN